MSRSPPVMATGCQSSLTCIRGVQHGTDKMVRAWGMSSRRTPHFFLDCFRLLSIARIFATFAIACSHADTSFVIVPTPFFMTFAFIPHPLASVLAFHRPSPLFSLLSRLLLLSTFIHLMLRNTMADNHLSLFCLVDGDSTPFSVDIDPSKTVDHLKDAIKIKKTPRFDDVAADELTLWRVSIPVVPPKERKPVVLTEIPSSTELDPTDDLSDVFKETPPKKTIHIIVQRLPQGNAAAKWLHCHVVA
ncbi:hypothetical protein BC939DRAFT_111021 [Gamsiella multidivaricata]|uniref:uncharacterized protein n=1 Tax=Gamsiella multidivaricata TaxID=101098 RepID=UPI0022211E26|nr:uncharacterized protein BC939DRAFT_111021 [Gamsiella multidivaricata]KAI7826478.1 hypothetical protein BC939DRAFT_111021 [Gamsiella multidivaricata]